MGVVYKARQQPFGRIVALKMVLAGAHAGKQIRSRFRIEGQAISRLQHPHVVQIYEFGEQDDLPFYSMEIIDGGSLSARLARGPMFPRDAAEVVRKLADAVHYAHQEQVLHRDLKPANILLTRAGEPKIVDFGLAKLLDEQDGQTCSDIVLGTPSYMAPEQAEARSADIGPATDIYALGAVLYQALTGTPPFKGASKPETLRQVVQAPAIAPSLQRPDVPRVLDAICLKCLEKDPQRRYATAADLRDDLGRFRRGEPTVARPPRWPSRARRWAYRHALALGAAVAALTLLGGLYWRDPQRVLNEADRLLRDGRPLNLVGPQGAPGYLRVVMGQPWSRVMQANDDCLAIHTWSACLVELLPALPCDSYVFRGQVRHETGEARSEAGLYFGGHDYQGFAPRTYTLLTFAYNDVATTAPNPDNSPLLEAVGFNGEPSNLLKPRHFRILVGPPFRPVRPGQWAATDHPPRWRDLEVEVRPDAVRASFDGVAVGEAEAKKLRGPLEGQRHLMIRNPPPGAYDEPAYRPRGSLGLWLVRGTASFRNVTITPLAQSS
jgi:eukaryotic-like serine/threonine-protein kinase